MNATTARRTAYIQFYGVFFFANEKYSFIT